MIELRGCRKTYPSQDGQALVHTLDGLDLTLRTQESGDRVVLIIPRPGRVRDTVMVDLPRHRLPDVDSHPRFAELKEYLCGQLRETQL